MSPNLTRRLLAGAAVLCGLWWIGSLATPPISLLLAGDHGEAASFFLFTFPVSIPGILAVIFGVRLFRAMSVTSLKWVLGSLAAFGVLRLATTLSPFLNDLLPERSNNTALLFLSSLVAFTAYLFAARGLMHHLTGQPASVVSLISRLPLALIAWQHWLLLFELFDEHAPIKPGYTHIHAEPWGTLAVLAPIAVAYGSYRVAVFYVTRAQQAEAKQLVAAHEPEANRRV